MNLSRCFSVVLCVTAVLLPPAFADEPASANELKAGLSPREAAANITVPDGFQVQLAAGEPQVHQPIAFAIDHRGRLWVAEAHTYPIRAQEGKGKDKIIILEDTDSNGTLDKRTVFIEGLNLVSGLEVGFGGVWVGAAPYLLFIADNDGDDRPDGKPEVLLDGFGFQDTHETLNAFIWGPDGWLYGCHGVFTHSRVGKPGTPDSERVPLNAGVWRYHPTRHQFDVFARGTSNPWGVDFDEHGQAFITACVIPHLYHVIQGARYQRQGGRHFNPYVYDDIQTIADHAHYAGNIRDHAWWGHEPNLPKDTSAAGGGHAHCGAMIYLGDNWPEPYRRKIYMNNIHGNRVNCDVLERKGSGFVGRHGKDLLFANDRWFRGINLKYGPDGSVYLIDWYDKNACHRRNPEIWDRTNGRIYRISYGDTQPEQTDLSKLRDKELVDLHLHKNEWFVRMARRILQERAEATRHAGSDEGVSATEAETPDLLRAIIANHQDPVRRLRAFWTLHATGFAAEQDYRNQLASDNEYLRAWAIQLIIEASSRQDGKVNEAVLDEFRELAAKDPSPVVRLYLASALQKLPLVQRWTISESLIGHAQDAKDHNLPLMYWYGINPLVSANVGRAMELATTSQIPLVRQFIIRRAAADNETLHELVRTLAESDDESWQDLVLGEMLRAFEGRVDIPMPESWKPAYEKLAASKNRELRERADQAAVVFGDVRIFPRMRELLSNSKADLDERRKAMGILLRGRDPQAAESLQVAVRSKGLRAAAIRALANYDDPKTPAVILDQFPNLLPSERRDAIGTLVARPSYAMAMLDAVDRGAIPRKELHAYHIRQIVSLNEKALNDRIRSVWGEIRATPADKKEKIEDYKKQLNAARIKTADASNGRRIFAKTCATCHTLFGVGEKIGPDITGSNRANLDYILENIVAPSAVLGKDYRMTVIATISGRVVSGLVRKETDSALTLRTINDTVVVPKSDIEEMVLSDKSLMPEGLLDQFSIDEIADLIKYLASPTQVALRGPRSPIDPKTNRVPGAVEGESMKIVGKTAGQARSQDMGHFPADHWSGNHHLWWTGAKPGARLQLEVPVRKAGKYRIEVVMTRARDYGIVQLSIGGQKLGGPIDLFNSPDVIATGVIAFDAIQLDAGDQRLTVEIVGAHPQAVKSYMFGLDYLRLVQTGAVPEKTVP